MNGSNDTITVDDSFTTEFYFAQAASDYTIAYDGNGDVTVTGGTTGTTTFKIGIGIASGDEIEFADGKTVALGYANGDGESDKEKEAILTIFCVTTRQLIPITYPHSI